MHRSARILATTSALAVLAVSGAHAAPAHSAVETRRTHPIASALAATLAAETMHFTVSLEVQGTRVTGTGSIDLSTARTELDVTVGDTRAELRRIGKTSYVNARQLGSRDERWVALDSRRDAKQMSARSVRSLISSLSPSAVLAALESAERHALIGSDADGIHYRVVSAAARASFTPLIGAFSAKVITDGPNARLDVWVGPSGLLTRLAIDAPRFSVDFSLRDIGAPLRINAPSPSQTGGPDSTSGRYLFGTGIRFSSPSSPVPSVTLAPTVRVVDGIVQGNLHATSAGRHALRFEGSPGTNGGKILIGNVRRADSVGRPQSFTVLPYATWLDGGPRGVESFTVRASEVTPISRYVSGLRLIGPIASASIAAIQGTPESRDLLAPVIGAWAQKSLRVNVGSLAPGGTPIALTYRVRGYRNTPISANFIPASGLSAGDQAATILKAPGLGVPGSIDPYETATAATGVLGNRDLRNVGGAGDIAYNVVTWDPRGEFGSGGTAQLANPFMDAVDVSSLIDWTATSLPTTLNGSNDPAVGIMGSSSGGAIALQSAALDPRVDAVVPAITWNSLIASLQPGTVVNTAATHRVLTSLSNPDIQLNPQIRAALIGGITTGHFSATELSLLAARNISTLLRQLQAPALLLQSTDDAVYPVTESLTTAQKILENPYGTPIKITWFNSRATDPARDVTLATYAKAWFSKYVAGVPIPDAFTPTFQFWDQTQTRYTSDFYPFDLNFNEPTPREGTSVGGRLTIAPTSAHQAAHLDVDVTGVTTGLQVVGAPALTVTYKGTGTSRALFARIIDTSTGSSFGAAPTPVPIVLDGKSHTVSVALSDMAYTAGVDPGLSLRLSTASAAFVQQTSGRIRITSITISCPIRA